jgi:hypothetical protein
MAASEQPDARRDPPPRKQAAILPATEEPRLIVLASVLELPGIRRKRAIAATLASMTRGENVVFVTDDLDFSPFVKQRLNYEYLPPIAQQALHAHHGPWDQYLVKRLRILVDKWAPVRILSPGTPFERYVEKARQ